MRLKLIVKPEAHEKTVKLLDLELEKANKLHKEGVHLNQKEIRLLGHRIPNFDDLLQFLLKRYFGGNIPFTFSYTTVKTGEFEIEFRCALERVFKGIGEVTDKITLGLISKLREKLSLQEPMLVRTAKKELKKDLKDDIIEITELETPTLTPQQEAEKQGKLIDKTFG